MVVRIRFSRGTTGGGERGQSQRTALAAAALLTPAALMASALGVWRIAADMKWAGSFAIPSGIFSHWQLWLGAAAALQFCSWMLNRYGNRGGTIF